MHCTGFRPQISISLLLAAAAAMANAATDSNAVLGFETPAGWMVKGDDAIPTALVSTTTRTQGNFAVALVYPASHNALTSLPVSSAATALSGLGNPGSVFEIDVLTPGDRFNPGNPGSLALSVSSSSAGLNHEYLGEVDFSRFPPGVYNTMQFAISDKVRNALGTGSFNDLVIELVLSSPGRGEREGQYLLDNLRVHSVPLVTGHPGLTPPPGYGGSVDFVVFGATPVAQSFPVEVLQVPDSLHLKLGAAGSTTVQLAIGYEGAPAFTCSFAANMSDPTGQYYAITSCTGGMQPGDLVGADWAQITIVGGDPTMKLRAQIAANPMGDMVGGGILPPMPTFWGDFDSCTPAPVAGQVVTTSASCTAQTAQANQIVTAYFNKVNNISPNWVVTPKPEFARRFGNGAPYDTGNPPPPPPANDPSFPFDKSGHMNPGGSFDAYWRLNGDISTSNSPNQTTHMDASFSGHAVLFGNDVNVLSVNANSDTSTGSSPTSSGSVHAYLFGVELPGGGSTTTGFNFNISQSQDLDLPPISAWIFSITLGASASVGVDASGTLAPSGIDINFGPNASLGVHAFGGINVGVASGGVDVHVDLLDVNTPVNVEALWSLSTLPTTCSASLKFSVDASVNISSGGGEVDLVATFGPCPFCYSKSWTLFSWSPLASTGYTLLNVAENVATFMLPTSACTQPLQVTINAPPGTAVAGIPINLVGTVTSPNAGNVNCLPYLCGGQMQPSPFSWSVAPPQTLNPASGQGCSVTATFTPGQRTLKLSATACYTDQFGRTITEAGSATENVNVTSLSAGNYIISTNPYPSGNPTPPFNNQSLSIQILGNSGPIQLTGEIVPPNPNLCSFWYVSPPGATIGGGGLNVTWTAVAGALYTIEFQADDCHGNHIGNPAVMQVNVQTIPQ